jgi:thiamine biosynthesis lipoprotein
LPLVNYKNINLNKEKSTVYLTKPGMKIDLGGIAKKYAMRMAMRKLQENGIKKALVNLGGDIQIKGGGLDNQPWKIGVKHPRKNDELVTIFKYKDKVIVSSGDYERYFIHNGTRYYHIFDPHTGYPAKKGVISATVITDGSIIADVLSTAIFTLGVEKGMELIKKIPDTDVLIIKETKTGHEIILSEGLKKQNLELKY